jgi:hypothetical protein
MSQAHHTEQPDNCVEGTCVRCRERDASDTVGLCPACSMQTRIEFAAGFRRLGEYLSAWAAFDDWCRDAGAGPACC